MAPSMAGDILLSTRHESLLYVWLEYYQTKELLVAKLDFFLYFQIFLAIMENPLDELDRIQSEMDSPTPPCDLTVPPSSSSHPPRPSLSSEEEVRCKICKITLKNKKDILVNHAHMYHRAEIAASRAATQLASQGSAKSLGAQGSQAGAGTQGRRGLQGTAGLEIMIIGRR